MAQPATTVGDIYNVIDTSFIPNAMKRTLRFQVQSLPTENRRVHIENLMTAVARLATIHFNKKMGVKDANRMHYGSDDSSSDTGDLSSDTDSPMNRRATALAVLASIKPTPTLPVTDADDAGDDDDDGTDYQMIRELMAPAAPAPSKSITAAPVAPIAPVSIFAPDDDGPGDDDDGSDDDDDDGSDGAYLSILLLLEDLQRDVDGRSPGEFLEAASSLLESRLIQFLPIRGELDFRARVSKTGVASRWITHLKASFDMLMDQGISSIRPARGNAVKMFDEQYRNDCILIMNPAYPTGAALAFVVIFFTLYETGSDAVFSECSGDMGEVIARYWVSVVERLKGKRVLGTDYLFGDYARYLSSISMTPGFTEQHVKDLQIPGKFWGFPKPTAVKRKPAGPAPTPTKSPKMPKPPSETD